MMIGTRIGIGTRVTTPNNDIGYIVKINQYNSDSNITSISRNYQLTIYRSFYATVRLKNGKFERWDLDKILATPNTKQECKIGDKLQVEVEIIDIDIAAYNNNFLVKIGNDTAWLDECEVESILNKMNNK